MYRVCFKCYVCLMPTLAAALKKKHTLFHDYVNHLEILGKTVLKASDFILFINNLYY